MGTIIQGPGPASGPIAQGIFRALGWSLVEAEARTFPDGEHYARIPVERLEGTVVVVQTMARPQDKSLMELLMLVEAARGLGAGRVVALAPYTAYARQDSRFLPGEPLSIAVVLRSIYASGADVYATVEIHKEHSLKHFPGPAVSVRPFSYMAEVAGIPGDALILAPDMGALPRARELALKPRYRL